LLQSDYPDGEKSVKALRWASEGNPFKARYYSYEEKSGMAPVYIWKDELGREIVSETKGRYGNTIRKFIEYNNNGSILRESEPTFEMSPQTWAKTYSYDDYGRTSAITTPVGVTTYSYNGLISTETSPFSTIQKKIFANGLTDYIIQNGKKITYTYHSSGLVKTSTPQGGKVISMEYDIQGNQIKITDPDAGIIQSKYNGFGELVWTKQSVHNASTVITTTNNFNPNGLLRSVTRTNGDSSGTTDSIAYTYDEVKNYRVNSISLGSKNTKSFEYDDLDHIIRTTEVIGDKIFVTKTEYDAFGRERKNIFPSGYTVTNWYDTNGFLTSVTDEKKRTLWMPLQVNAKGQILRENRGGVVTTLGYDNRGFLDSISSPGIIRLAYSFDNKANLNSRCDRLTNQKELFTYDGFNRLTNWNIYRDEIFSKSNSQTYNATTGNIAIRSDLDNLPMSYGQSGHPHLLDSIAGIPSNLSTSNLFVTYTDFKKIQTLTEGSKSYELTYGVDDERRMSLYKVNNAIKLTRYYLGDYEEEVYPNGTIRKIHYLSGGAVLIRNNGVDSLLYGYSDHQGSLIALTDESGNVLERYAYDPWGNRRNPSDWTQKDTRTSFLLNRGYTMHEHLDAFGIINMNALGK
jgi:YD repeat-containing protein